jgi:hypothetical protein
MISSVVVSMSDPLLTGLHRLNGLIELFAIIADTSNQLASLFGGKTAFARGVADFVVLVRCHAAAIGFTYMTFVVGLGPPLICL